MHEKNELKVDATTFPLSCSGTKSNCSVNGKRQPLESRNIFYICFYIYTHIHTYISYLICIISYEFLDVLDEELSGCSIFLHVSFFILFLLLFFFLPNYEDKFFLFDSNIFKLSHILSTSEM